MGSPRGRHQSRVDSKNILVRSICKGLKGWELELGRVFWCRSVPWERREGRTGWWEHGVELILETVLVTVRGPVL